MIEILSKKMASGEIDLNLARQHIARHEWGLARFSVEAALEKGGLSDPKDAHDLMGQILQRLR